MAERKDVMKIRSILVLFLMGLSTSVFPQNPDNASKIDCVVYDIGADRPVAHTTVEFVVYSDCASGPEILRSSALTGEHGEFQTSLPVGQHLLSVTSPLTPPVRRCINIASAKEIESCGSRTLQRLLVRTVSGHRPLPADILDAYPCAPYSPTVCEALNLPRIISSKHAVFMDDKNRPFANATLEFRRYSKARGELFGTATTDSEGAADLSAIYAHPNAAGSLAYVAVNKSTFLLELSLAPTNQPQRIRVVKWQCGGQEHAQATSE
jgi:hypothetical protein